MSAPTTSRCDVLLIEDSPSDAALLQATLADDPLGSAYDVLVCTTLDEGLRAARQGAFDLLLLDLNLPDSHGFETFQRVADLAERLPIVVLTSLGGEDLAAGAVRGGAQDFIFKDRLDPFWLARSLQHAVCRHALMKRIKLAEAAMAHEMRTPLNAILGFSELLLQPELAPHDGVRFARIIHRNAAQLLAIVNDTLDLAKACADDVHVTFTEVDVAEVVTEVVTTMAPLAAANDVSVHNDLDPCLNARITTDAQRLRQILLNVIGNAVKFTHRGQVFVRLARDAGGVEVEIEDTGEGMAVEQQRRLFHPFSAGPASACSRFGGTGLGLMLAKRLAGALAGDLRLARSAPSAGSTFVLRLPMAPGQALAVPV